MLALDDQLVPYSLLKLCIQAYVPSDADPTLDPLISPVLLADEVYHKVVFLNFVRYLKSSLQ